MFRRSAIERPVETVIWITCKRDKIPCRSAEDEEIPVWLPSD